MSQLVAAIVVVGLAGLASTAAAEAPAHRATRVDKAAARRALLAARAECKTPGKRIDSLLARYFDPHELGANVIAGWSQLGDDERVAFAREADRVVGARARASALAQLCKRKVCVDKPWLNDDAPGGDDVVRIKLWDLDDGADSVRVSLQQEGARWRLVAIRFYGVSNFDREWRLRFDPSTAASDHGAAYDKAMEYLRSH